MLPLLRQKLAAIQDAAEAQLDILSETENIDFKIMSPFSFYIVGKAMGGNLPELPDKENLLYIAKISDEPEAEPIALELSAKAIYFYAAYQIVYYSFASVEAGDIEKVLEILLLAERLYGMGIAAQGVIGMQKLTESFQSEHLSATKRRKLQIIKEYKLGMQTGEFKSKSDATLTLHARHNLSYDRVRTLLKNV